MQRTTCEQMPAVYVVHRSLWLEQKVKSTKIDLDLKYHKNILSIAPTDVYTKQAGLTFLYFFIL